MNIFVIGLTLQIVELFPKWKGFISNYNSIEIFQFFFEVNIFYERFIYTEILKFSRNVSVFKLKFLILRNPTFSLMNSFIFNIQVLKNFIYFFNYSKKNYSILYIFFN